MTLKKKRRTKHDTRVVFVRYGALRPDGLLTLSRYLGLWQGGIQKGLSFSLVPSYKAASSSANHSNHLLTVSESETGSRANLRSDTSLLATRYLYDSETIGLKEFEIQPIALNSTGLWRVAKANAASASLAASAAAPIVSGGAPSSDFRGIKPPFAPLRSVYSTIA